MIRTISLLGVIISFFFIEAQAQAIYMKVDGMPVGGPSSKGELIKALEWKPNRETLPLELGQGGEYAGVAKPGYLIIKKENGKTTEPLLRKMVGLANTINWVEFSFYENGAATPFYTIKLESVLVTQLFWLSPECPTCLQLEHQIAFAFEKVTTFDIINNTGTLWNLKSNTVTPQ